MTDLELSMPQLHARIFNTPLLIREDKGRAIVHAIQSRLNVSVDANGIKPEAFRAPGNSERSSLGYRIFDGIGILDVNGTLVHKGAWLGSYSGMVSYDSLSEQIEAARQDGKVRELLINFNTFGGEANGCPDLCDQLFEFRETKPVYALASDFADSAGYMLASQCNQVFVTQSGEVGSVGVVMMHVDYSDVAADAGIVITHIYAGDRKIDGTPWARLSEAARERFEEEVGDHYTNFVEKVARGRGLDAEAVIDTQAMTYMGPRALEVNFADGVVSGRDLLDRIREERTGASSRLLIQQETSEMDKSKDLAEAAAKGASDERTRLTEAISKGLGVEASALSKAIEADDYAPIVEAVSEPAKKTAGKAAAADAETKVAEAAKAERDRVGAIIGCDEAKGRSKLAQHLAFETDMSADQAKAVLGSANPDAEGPADPLAKAMGETEQPEVGADVSDDTDEPTRLAKQILNA